MSLMWAAVILAPAPVLTVPSLSNVPAVVDVGVSYLNDPKQVASILVKIGSRALVEVKDSKGNEKNKLFIKSIDYNNKNNKSDLKKLENETSKNLAEKIAEEIVGYLQSI